MRPPKVLIDHVQRMLDQLTNNVEHLKEERVRQLRQLTETDAKIREDTNNIVALETWLRDAEAEVGK